MTRKSGDKFVPSWIENPALQVHPPSQIEQGRDRGTFIAQVVNPDRVIGVSGKSGYRIFIIDDANWHTVATQASNNAKTLIIAANDDGSHRAGGGIRAGYHNRLEACTIHLVADRSRQRLTEPVP
jgi:hypothetical protein